MMKRVLFGVFAAFALTAMARKAGVNQLPSVTADIRNQITPTKKMKNMDKGFPYEVRVDRETIPGKAIHWYSDGHAVTVTPHVVDCVRLTNAVDAAVLRLKKNRKDFEKAQKKDAKAVGKAVDELEKLKDKAESEEVKALFDDAIEIFSGK